jgi:molybdate transport system ATP-binding protein
VTDAGKRNAPDRLAVQVRKQLGAFALDCAFDAPLSGVTALFGPSGAGKSTLIHLLAGLARPDAGRIAVGPRVFFDGAAGIDVPAERRGVGVVFQDARLFPHLTVARNLRFGARRAAGPPLPRVTFDAVVDLLGIGALLERRPHTLSGGERQRVAIGRALLAQPRLLLMDEPLASLDAPRKAEVLPYIEALRDEFEVPVVYVSHAIDEVLRLARTLVVLDGGRILAAGPLEETLQGSAAARLFPAAEAGSLLACRVLTHDARLGLTTLALEGGPPLRVPAIALPPGARLRVRVPARDVALALTEPRDVSTVNRLAGTIARMTSLDATHVEVQVAVERVTLAARITHEAAERLSLAPGRPVWCLIKSVALDRATLHATPQRPDTAA